MTASGPTFDCVHTCYFCHCLPRASHLNGSVYISVGVDKCCPFRKYRFKCFNTKLPRSRLAEPEIDRFSGFVNCR